MNRRFIYILILAFFSFAPSIFAIDASCDISTYECYRDYWVKQFCEGKERPWNDASGLGDAVSLRYVPFTVDEQRALIEEILQTEKNPSERVRLEQDLSPARLASNQGFLGAEIARIQHRTNMNRLFSCAVTQSRKEKITKIMEITKETSVSPLGKILSRDLTKMTEITQNSCGQNLNDRALNNLAHELASSATKEFCSYTNYLNYLEKIMEKDYSAVQKIDTDILQALGNTSTNAPVVSMTRVTSHMMSFGGQIQSNRIRAKETLKKALIAYREMERTYPAHLLLLFIEQDYIELRSNLDVYLSAVSQLFEKAKNAQSLY